MLRLDWGAIPSRLLQCPRLNLDAMMKCATQLPMRQEATFEGEGTAPYQVEACNRYCVAPFDVGRMVHRYLCIYRD